MQHTLHAQHFQATLNDKEFPTLRGGLAAL